MGVIVRLTTSAADYLEKEAERLGRTLLADGGGTKHRIRDGFILRAVRAGENAIVTILDLPRFFGGPGWRLGPNNSTVTMVTAKVPDALRLLTPSAAVVVHEVGNLGFYAPGGVVSIGTPEQELVGIWMESPLSVCRTALISSFAPVALPNETKRYSFQLVRLNGATNWSEEAPEGLLVQRLTVNPDPYTGGAAALPSIKFSTTALGIPDLPPFEVLGGPCIESDALHGVVTLWPHFATSFGGSVPDSRFLVASYSLAATAGDDGQTNYSGVIDWSTNLMSDVIPADPLQHVMYAPQTWGIWSVSAGARQDPELPPPPVIAVAAGVFKRRIDNDPAVEPPLFSQAWSHYTLFLSINAQTGAVAKTVLFDFDSWSLNYTELQDKEYTPVAAYSVGNQPFIMCAVRTTDYEVVDAPDPLDPPRKQQIALPSYTRLVDISHTILNSSGGQTTVNLGGYFVAYGAKYVYPTISGSGRFHYTGWHTVIDPGGETSGSYFPRSLSGGGHGGSPMFRAVCLYAPGILVAVVTPAAQYLSADQDRHLMLLDAVTGAVLDVSANPLTALPYDVSVGFQLSVFEQGDVDEDGVLIRHAGLIVSIGVDDAVLGGTFVTHDFGATLHKVATGPRLVNVHYLGSPLGPVALGDTTGIPVLEPPPILA